jgi:hypothetical protein
MIDQRPEDDFIEISVALGAAGSCRDRGAGGVDERGFVADRDPISALGRLLVLGFGDLPGRRESGAHELVVARRSHTRP